MAATGPSTDIAFARKMLAPHRGAVDMSNVEISPGAGRRP